MEELFKHWHASKVELNSPANTQQIAAFENLNGVIFPEDFRTYLLLANGFSGGSTDQSMISFWPLEDFKTISRNSMETFILFADFLIESHYYAIKLRSPENAQLGSIWAIAGQHFAFVAKSFVDFIEVYLTPHKGEFGNPVLAVKW